MIFVYLTLFTLNNVILPAKHRSTGYRSKNVNILQTLLKISIFNEI